MASLPSYLAAAKPVPFANRAAWYKTIMPAYAGVMLWFVFWQELAKGPGTPGGLLAAGVGPAFLGLIVGAVICHFFFYMAPGMLGVRTGLPLYVVGTSTYGVWGGFFMPGLLMGVLQFGWLGVNAFAVANILCKCFGVGLAPDGTEALVPGMTHGVIATVFVIIAAFIGLKGIKYVAGVATYLPLIPVVILLILLAKTWGGLTTFRLEQLCPENPTLEGGLTTSFAVIGFLTTYIVGFFATAGAAGVDIASNARNEDDVHIGGLTGIVLPTVLAGEAVLLIVMGAYGTPDMIQPANVGNMNPVGLMSDIAGGRFANFAMIGLAIASIPGACFSALVAANSFKTTMPKVNPFISVGIGSLVSIFLAVTGLAGKVVPVFLVIGASFGPICGAMLADFLLSGRKWSGPRMGFNPAGWISWAVGFVVGAFNLVIDFLLTTDLANTMPSLAEWKDYVPVAPVSAMVVGFVLYLVLSLIGVRSRLVDAQDMAS